MKKYLKIWKQYIVLSIAGSAAYRANFILDLIVSFAWIFLYLQLITIIFANSQSVAGLSRAEVMVVFGLYELMDGIASMFIWANIEGFAELIQKGMLDYVVTKPIDAQFHISFNRFKLTDIAAVISGLGILAYALTQTGVQFNFVNVIACIILLIGGLILYYSIALLAITLSFWFIRLENITMLLTMSYVMARYPMNIFEGALRQLVFFVIPIAFFATVPALVLFDKVSLVPWTIGGLLIAATFFVAARLFWLTGLRSYSSASS